jgi:hypothetical protein
VSAGYTSGRYPSVSLSDDFSILITHKTSFGYETYYSQGLLKGHCQREADDTRQETVEIVTIEDSDDSTTGTLAPPLPKGELVAAGSEDLNQKGMPADMPCQERSQAEMHEMHEMIEKVMQASHLDRMKILSEHIDAS